MSSGFGTEVVAGADAFDVAVVDGGPLTVLADSAGKVVVDSADDPHEAASRASGISMRASAGIWFFGDTSPGYVAGVRFFGICDNLTL